jgi:hypothetical protein
MLSRGTIVLSAALAAACSNTTSLGSTGACFAADDDGEDEERPFASREESRSGATRVPPADQVGAPPSFQKCADGMQQSGEFIDRAGARFWLAVDARLGEEELLPRELFSVIEDAQIDVNLERGWMRSDTVAITDRDDRLLIALQKDATLRDPPGTLRVEDDGGDALPSPQGCGPVTTHRLKFTDSKGAHSVGNGSEVELVVDGTEFLAYNIFSLHHSGGGCEDGPFKGLHATWVAFDNSL